MKISTPLFRRNLTVQKVQNYKGEGVIRRKYGLISLVSQASINYLLSSQYIFLTLLLSFGGQRPVPYICWLHKL